MKKDSILQFPQGRKVKHYGIRTTLKRTFSNFRPLFRGYTCDYPSSSSIKHKTPKVYVQCHLYDDIEGIKNSKY